ncbi:MAG: hypothetical protein LBQ31_09540 [Bacteroidales bacterium]|nr:hypothetical protein [Bacteroidales bacterium]
MGVPPPLAELGAGSGFRLYLFCIGQSQTPLTNSSRQTSRHQPQKRMSAQSLTQAPRTAPACADYAERERLHCEAIIPNASPPQCPTRTDYSERERLHCEAIIPNAAQRRPPTPTAAIANKRRTTVQDPTHPQRPHSHPHPHPPRAPAPKKKIRFFNE